MRSLFALLATAALIAGCETAPPIAAQPLADRAPRGLPTQRCRLDIPLAERRAHPQAHASVEVLVGLDGHATEGKVIESSGTAEFDKAVLRFVQCLDFEPAVSQGKKVAVRHVVPVVYLSGQ